MGAIMNALLALHLLPLLNPILPYHTLYQSFSLHSLYSHSPFVTRSDDASIDAVKSDLRDRLYQQLLGKDAGDGDTQEAREEEAAGWASQHTPS